MKTIFFNYPVGSPKVSLITTSKRVSQLMSDEVIPKNAGYVEHDLIDENSNRNDLAMVGMPQHLKFDNVNFHYDYQTLQCHDVNIHFLYFQ